MCQRVFRVSVAVNQQALIIHTALPELKKLISASFRANISFNIYNKHNLFYTIMEQYS